MPFLVVSLPAFLWTILLLFCTYEPKRGEKERAFLEQKIDEHEDDSSEVLSEDRLNADCSTDDVHINCDNPVEINADLHSLADVNDNEHRMVSWKTTWELFKIPTFSLILFQSLPVCLVWGVFSVFLNDYLAQDRGLSIQVSIDNFCLIFFLKVN